LLYAQFGYSTTTFTVVKQASIGSWTTDKDMAAAGATSTGYFLTTPDLAVCQRASARVHEEHRGFVVDIAV
jgi:hypothetical protein